MSKFISRYTRLYASSETKKVEKRSGYRSNCTSAYEKRESIMIEEATSLNKKVTNPNFVKVNRGVHV